MARIKYIKGDIFESKAQVIVNTVNCKGVMGKGLALAFKQRYPEMFVVYQQECKTGRLRIGRPTLYQKCTPWILNFPTKDNWKANSKIEYLEKGLEYLSIHYKEVGIKSIAFPKLGAQNGKLSWDDVGPLMIKYLSKLDLDVDIYIAEGDREYFPQNIHAQAEKEKEIWKQFSDLALSIERLQSEIQLSKPQAKKLYDLRQTIEICSFSDVNTIDGLANVSLKRIKDFINQQLYVTSELPGMSHARDEGVGPSIKKRKSTNSKSKPKRAQVNASGCSTPPLFSIS